MSVVFSPGHLQEMTLVLWEKLCTLHRQNSLNQVTLSLPASGRAQWTFQEQEDDLRCLPHSLFFLGQSFQPIPEEVRHIPSLASLLKIHLFRAEVQIILIWHHLNSMDEQKYLFFPSFTLVLSSQCTSSALTQFAYLILLVHYVDTEDMRWCLTTFEYFVSTKPSTLSS